MVSARSASLLTYNVGYVYPGPQIFYGQSFMCMTLGNVCICHFAASEQSHTAMDQFDLVMQGLEVDWVEVYDSNLLPAHARMYVGDVMY